MADLKEKFSNKINMSNIDDNPFDHRPLEEKKFYRELKKNNVKICLVSPELVKIKRMREIKKVISFLKINM